jgi:hypothetical protein
MQIFWSNLTKLFHGRLDVIPDFDAKQRQELCKRLEDRFGQQQQEYDQSPSKKLEMLILEI